MASFRACFVLGLRRAILNVHIELVDWVVNLLPVVENNFVLVVRPIRIGPDVVNYHLLLNYPPTLGDSRPDRKFGKRDLRPCTCTG